MPLPYLADVVVKGASAVPLAAPALKIIPCLFLIWVLKVYFGGASNHSERLMASKVIMVTGGTSGIGAAAVKALAARRAQIIMLTSQPPSDPFLADYIEDLRNSTGNELIYAEQVDLASLHSIREFATKWVDNAPPRRLDMILLCADTLIPKFGVPRKTDDKIDVVWGINYLANFHLLSILSPAIRAQPPDRDVRIVFTTCSSYVGGKFEELADSRDPLPKGRKYETSKLANMVFAQSFQKHLDEYKRPDKQPNNARVVLVDPGFTRTPGMRRWLTGGSLWGLLVYWITFPFWWLILKSPLEGAQGLLMACMEGDLGQGPGGRLLKECRDAPFSRKEVTDEKVQQKLWTFSETQIQTLEKESAARRALSKKEKADAGEGSNGVEKQEGTNQSKRQPGSRRSRKAA